MPDPQPQPEPQPDVYDNPNPTLEDKPLHKRFVFLEAMRLLNVAIKLNDREVDTPGSVSPQLRAELARLLKKVQKLLKKHATQMLKSKHKQTSYIDLYLQV